MKKRAVTLKDIANELGVSISTVSRALRDHSDISPEIIRNVKKLAIEKNYIPNPLAMGLRRQQTKMIGVIVPDIVTHFYSSVISGIEDTAKENGYYILIASSSESLEKEKIAVQNLLKSRVEGLIICISQETDNYEHFEPLIKNEIPIVFFDRVPETVKVPSVIVDGMKAAKNIVRHFFDSGCRKIAYISGPEHLNISRQRKKGYIEGLKETGLKFVPEYLIECKLTINDAKKATQKLLDLEDRPDAIFGINDTVAFAAMREIKNKGLNIPNDIALVGFTDDFHATVVDPALTSVTHPTKMMGREAAKLFFEQISKEEIFLNSSYCLN